MAKKLTRKKFQIPNITFSLTRRRPKKRSRSRSYSRSRSKERRRSPAVKRVPNSKMTFKEQLKASLLKEGAKIDQDHALLENLAGK